MAQVTVQEQTQVVPVASAYAGYNVINGINASIQQLPADD